VRRVGVRVGRVRERKRMRSNDLLHDFLIVPRVSFDAGESH